MGQFLTKWLWRLFIGAIILFTLLIIAINFGLLGYMPSMSELENPSANEASTVYAADGTELGKYYYENRTPVDYKDISPNVFNALIATEDERFHSHSGIDGIALMRAVFNFGKKGGGSTITQQLAKNLFPRENVNIFTLGFIKLKEWVTAVKLERNLTKNEIITLYLNTVPFGGNIYGIKTAANTYYSKEPKDLTVDEAAVLIGMLKANTLYNPKRNPEKSKGRRNVVIQKMIDNNYLSESEGASYKAKPIALNYRMINHSEGAAPYFRQVLEIEVKKWAKNKKKDDGSDYDIYKDGLKIYTSIEPKMQKYAEESVLEHLEKMQSIFAGQANIKSGSVWTKKTHANVLKRHIEQSDRYLYLKEEGKSHEEIMKIFNTKVKMKIFSYKGFNNEVDTIMSPLDSLKYMRAILQAGFMVMDPYTGEIKAWVGGVNHKYFKFDHLNIGTKRQVGSTIKPFVYALAVDNGISPCASVSTAPQHFAGQKSYYDAGGSKYGSMSMSSALAASVNNASLYLLKQVGINNFVDFVKRIGITSKIEAVPSIALGVSDISVYEMLQGYTMFPNSGIVTQPLMITKIEDKYGNVLEVFTPEQKEVISTQLAYQMVKMMQGVIEKGTGRALRSYGLTGEISGKTGTTNSQADAWFIGYTPQYLGGVWVGCDDRFLRFNSMIGQGAKSALPIWGLFFKKLKNDPDTNFDQSIKFDVPKNFDYCSTTKVNQGYNNNPYYAPRNNSSSSNNNHESDLSSESNNNTDIEEIEEEIPIIPGTSEGEWTN